MPCTSFTLEAWPETKKEKKYEVRYSFLLGTLSITNTNSIYVHT